MARTIENQNQARSIFYGMMILEGIVALIWAYATIVMFDGKTLLELIKIHILQDLNMKKYVGLYHLLHV